MIISEMHVHGWRFYIYGERQRNMRQRKADCHETLNTYGQLEHMCKENLVAPVPCDGTDQDKMKVQCLGSKK